MLLIDEKNAPLHLACKIPVRLIPIGSLPKQMKEENREVPANHGSPGKYLLYLEMCWIWIVTF